MRTFKMRFGCWKGKTLAQIKKKDAGYLEWLSRQRISSLTSAERGILLEYLGIEEKPENEHEVAF